MTVQNLKANQRVQIELQNKYGFFVRYPSRIEYIEGATIALAAPLKNRLPFQVPVGTEISVWFWDNSAIYSFRSKMISNITEGVPLLIITYPTSVEKVQNREFVRVKCNINVHLSYENKGGVCEIWCKTRDISGGGMMLVLNKPLPLTIKDEVRLEFQLKNDPIWAKGTIVWNDWELDANGVERNIVGIKLSDISEKNRQTIIRFVFEKQIDLRRKGLL